jgi:hypothetical protein
MNQPGGRAQKKSHDSFCRTVVVPALMPDVGLKVLNLSSSNLGLLFTSMWSWIGHWSDVRHSLTASSLVARLPHPLGEFAIDLGICHSLRPTSLVTKSVDVQTQNLLGNGSIAFTKNLTGFTACHTRVSNL